MLPYSVLFFCTGNYYRSRFAELYFNHLAAKKQVNLKAFSKGLRLSERNKGPLSPHTLSYFEKMGIPTGTPRNPQTLEAIHFSQAHYLIGMDRDEHLPMIQDTFPEFLPRITFWSFADDYLEAPDSVLPALQEKTEHFFTHFKIP